MPQFTVTKNTIDKLKLKEFSEDQSSELPFYDNWLVHISKISIYDVMFFAHMQTRVILSIPIFEVGSAKKAFEAFPKIMEEAIDQISMYKEGFLSEKARYEFEIEPNTFCKGKTLSVSAHITQYKRLLEHYASREQSLSKLICDTVSSKWLDWYITTPTCKDYTSPIELWRELLKNYEADFLVLSQTDKCLIL